MVFDSFVFAVFLVVVLGLYGLLRRRGQNIMLLAASYVFYGWWDWRFLSLLWISTLLDFAAGLWIHHARTQRARRAWLIASLCGNLGILGFFKYFNFFAANLQAGLAAFGVQADPLYLDIVLPVGISFYTFQTMTYALDIYMGRMTPTRSLLNFALFVAFFPQLVAGPIERARHLLPQIEADRRPTRTMVYDGAWLILWGLYKKMFIADNVARIVDQVYGAPGDFSAFHIMVATYAFAVQIYCDFSGYSDIAIGVGKLMGFDIMLNFRLPYFAKNPSEFWRRWHISLSDLLRDYLYIPLGGNRCGPWRQRFNLMATMTLGGLWHGAQWHFVVWGVYHGLLLAVYRPFRAARDTVRETPAWMRTAAIVVMFHLTCVGWMLFRVRDIPDMFTICGKMVGDWSVSSAALGDLASLAGFSWLLVVMQLAQHLTGDLLVVRRLPAWARAALYVILYLSLTLGGAFDDRPFIYFQF